MIVRKSVEKIEADFEKIKIPFYTGSARHRNLRGGPARLHAESPRRLPREDEKGIRTQEAERERGGSKMRKGKIQPEKLPESKLERTAEKLGTVTDVIISNISFIKLKELKGKIGALMCC